MSAVAPPVPPTDAPKATTPALIKPTTSMQAPKPASVPSTSTAAAGGVPKPGVKAPAATAMAPKVRYVFKHFTDSPLNVQKDIKLHSSPNTHVSLELQPSALCFRFKNSC
jgi:hypothetical protein